MTTTETTERPRRKKKALISAAAVVGVLAIGTAAFAAIKWASTIGSGTVSSSAQFQPTLTAVTSAETTAGNADFTYDVALAGTVVTSPIGQIAVAVVDAGHFTVTGTDLYQGYTAPLNLTVTKQSAAQKPVKLQSVTVTGAASSKVFAWVGGGFCGSLVDGTTTSLALPVLNFGFDLPPASGDTFIVELNWVPSGSYVQATCDASLTALAPTAW